MLCCLTDYELGEYGIVKDSAFPSYLQHSEWRPGAHVPFWCASGCVRSRTRRALDPRPLLCLPLMRSPAPRAAARRTFLESLVGSPDAAMEQSPAWALSDLNLEYRAPLRCGHMRGDIPTHLICHATMVDAMLGGRRQRGSPGRVGTAGSPLLVVWHASRAHAYAACQLA